MLIVTLLIALFVGGTTANSTSTVPDPQPAPDARAFIVDLG
jgi:hypothetical protein